MAGSLERRPDGSVALFINGDLQFDSADERIYHESIVLPGLAIAASRKAVPLKALVIGGGDGLAARELFKSERISSVDLVDYDAEIIAMAKGDFRTINAESLFDARINIHIEDAWNFVKEALDRSARYDLVIVDLTVPEDISSARFHSIDWYKNLATLLASDGVLVANGVSAQATPEAFWCVFNSMLGAGLHPRPYHFAIPSFVAHGFGDDWAFYLASNREVTKNELAMPPDFTNSRQFLLDTQHLLSLFDFPEALFDYQTKASPALSGSDILLHYFYNANALATTDGAKISTLEMDTRSLTVPQADAGKNILPPNISEALAESICAIDKAESVNGQDAEIFLYGILDLMPSLKREHTREVIDDFLEDPSAFLQAIDLPGLVARLLKRASELPAQLVIELELLRDALSEWAGDHLSLLSLGRRVVTVLMLVLVVGNLLYPDMVYGKGEAHAGSGAHHGDHRGVGGGGRRGGGYWNGSTWVGPTYLKKPQVIERNITRPSPNMQIKQYQAPHGKPGGGVPSSMIETPDTRPNKVATCIDHSGTVYPARRYWIDPASLKNERLSGETATSLKAGDHYAAYKLGPGVDLLVNGNVVMPLTEQSYLMVTGSVTQVLDQESGSYIFGLYSDANLLALLNAAIDRQHDMQKPEWQTSRDFLNAAKVTLYGESQQTETRELPALSDAVEVFPSVWLTQDGKALAVRCQTGDLAYLDGQKFYRLQDNVQEELPYPAKFKAVTVSYLSKIVRDFTATQNTFLKDKEEIESEKTALLKELQDYQSSLEHTVQFGSRKLAKAEAVRLTELAISRANQRINLLDKNLEQLPAQIALANVALTNLTG